MPPYQYNGISNIYTSEYKASGSRFLGFLFPVASAQEFETCIKEYKALYADATHVCSGCVIGLEREYQRCSDDGEPSNSSGRPILNALLSAEITRVGCAVVRYYGGTKLGIPGLIEAYGVTANLCIERADIQVLTEMSSIECTINPAKSYLLYNYLNRQKNLSYTTDTTGTFKIHFPKSMTDELQKGLKNITSLKINN